MNYISAKDVLPMEIIRQIQSYVDGQIIYIPKSEPKKKGRKVDTLAKRELSIRNTNIYMEYISGLSIKQLSQKYFLVEKSIQRIIRQESKIITFIGRIAHANARARVIGRLLIRSI